ncbi:MAG TPA: hypothetical protein VHO29_03575 [Marmoricola sp.]|nr:hypothetical protein [Marmoricola sp.]
MRRRTCATTTFVLAVSLGSLGACGFGGSGEQSSAEVQPVSQTTVEAGPVQVVIPAGSASGGKVTVEDGPEPTMVPEGVKALGSSAVVSLTDGSLDGSMTVSFAPPSDLAGDDVPIVMAKQSGADWQWLPTSWEGGDARVKAEMAGPGEVFLAKFDRGPAVADAVEEFTAKTNNPSKAPDPDCGDEQRPLDNGLEVSSEDGDLVKWCAGVDTIESTPAVTEYDLDPYTDGAQVTVLRVTNNSRMFEEIGYPKAWPAVDGSGHALPGQELRSRLGLAGTIRDGLASRVMAPGETLNLLLPGSLDELSGTVTADLSAAAWTLSALDFASSTYTGLVMGVDQELGDQVRAAREALMGTVGEGSGLTFAAPREPQQSGGLVEPEVTDGTDGTDGTDSAEAPEPATTLSDEDLAALRDCLSPAADAIIMDQDTAKRLVEQAMACAASSLQPALSDEYGAGPAEMADGVASSVLTGLPAELEQDDEPWSQITDAHTDQSAGFQVWVGTPPA